MLDMSKIAGRTIAEIRVLRSKLKVASQPHAATDVRVKESLATAPLPKHGVLEKALVELLWASTLAEEGRPCRARLLYLEPDAQGRCVHWFDKPVALNREALRKLSPAHGPRGYLCWADDGGVPIIVGIEPRFGNHPGNLILSAPAAVAIDVLWLSARILTVRNGETRTLSTCGLPSLRDTFDALGMAFHHVIEPQLLGATVQAIVDGGHGGALWIANDRHELSGVTLPRIKTDERALLQRFPKLESRQPWLLSIGYMCAVDGAVVIDCNLNVLGFGAFIDAKTSNVCRLRIDGGDDIVTSSELGGGRHRSAVEFCARNAPAAAIVVSTDGRITIVLCRSAGDLPKCAEIVSLGFPA